MTHLKAQMILLTKRSSYVITLTAMCLFAIFAFLSNCISEFGNFAPNVHAAKYMFLGNIFSKAPFFIFSIIFPLVAVIPFSDTFFEERRNKTFEFCLSRHSNSNYYYSKLAAVFISGFLIMFIPLIINFLLNFIAFPFDSSIDFTNFATYKSSVFGPGVNSLVLLKGMFAKNIYAYIFLHIIIMGLSSALMAVVVYQISFFYNSSRIALLSFIFIIYHLYSIVLSRFGMDEFCIDNYMFASALFSKQSLRGLILVYSMLTLAAVLPIPFAKRKLRNMI